MCGGPAAVTLVLATPSRHRTPGLEAVGAHMVREA